MKTRIFIILISITIIFNIYLKAGVEDICGTESGKSAPFLPTSGTIKVFVIFAQFVDDPNTENNGWAKDSYPDWANTFVNPSTGGGYSWNNLSHYFNEMSNGTFQVIGDVYDELVVTDFNQSYYTSIGQVNREIIMKVDPYVNFSVYDNLNGNTPGSDGIVDFIYIIYRNVTGSSLMNYSGIAHLEVSQTMNVDGKQIVNNTYIGGGVQQRGGFNGRDYTLYVAAHEMGHYLFGGGHIDYVSNLALMTRLPVWDASRGMHSWERQKLGWINYTDKTTDGSVTMSDYMTADQVYRVPISSTEYFLVENRKKISPHDKAGDTGFYFYRVTGASSFPPTIDVLCADGNWDFNFNYNTLKITRVNPNSNSTSDEMNIKYLYDSNGDGKLETYACYTPVYHENSAWGDNEDAFDLTFNNVLSPVSNPRSNNDGSLDFTIEVTGTNTIQFYFTNPYAGKPSKPQNYNVTIVNIGGDTYPKLTWELNLETDVINASQAYLIERSLNGGAFTQIAAVNGSISEYIDYDLSYAGSGPNTAVYKIRAKDTQGLTSLYTEGKSVAWGDAWKIGTNAIEIVKEYKLQQNYPNPFNPMTSINYQIKEKGLVSLKVFDMLGKEVAELVNETKDEGQHSIMFDASNLPSGVYIYSIRVNDYVQNNKMTLLK
ncbi:MAG: T9SS type A sorting domain-containing protein [Ignavibacteriaceae bacterium]|nr:T9SS type A sorting domain-containing protein [Ignavibacteriaceae bacterium]